MTAGLVMLGDQNPIQAERPGLTSVPSTAGERVEGAWDAAQTPDRYWNVQGARKQRADKIIDDYKAMTGETLLNPYDNAPTQKEIAETLGQPTTVIYAKRLEAMREKTRQLKQGLPNLGGLPDDFMDVDSIDASIASDSGGARAREERLVGTGNGLAGFGGAAAGEMFSPHGVASMFFPVSRLPAVAAERTVAGWARNIGKEVLLQGVVQGGVQAAASVVDFNTRKQFGTEQTHEQLAEEILSAAGGGMLFGGAFRGSHLAIRKLLGHGADVPPAVADAALALESKALYGEKNALNVAPAAHEAAIDRAVADVSLGRAATVAEAAAPPERPRFEAPADQASIPPKPFDEALEAKRAEVWADKETVGGSREGLARNEQFVTEEARLRLMHEEAPETVALVREQGGLTDDDVANIGRQYKRGANETPDQAVARTADAYVEAKERGAIQDDGRFEVSDHEFVSDPRAMLGRDPELERLFDAVYGKQNDRLPIDIPFVSSAEEAAVGKPATATPQDKARDAMVRHLVAEEGAASAEQKRAYEAATMAEREANIAVSCVGGGAM